MKGEPLELNGKLVYFVPFRTGANDRPKRDAYYAMVTAFEAHDNAPQDTPLDTFRELYEACCAAVGEFAYQMLKDNYEDAEARSLAGEVPVGWAVALGVIARTGAPPEGFTKAGTAGTKPAAPSGK